MNEELMDSSKCADVDWDYEADLGQLKDMASNSTGIVWLEIKIF